MKKTTMLFVLFADLLMATLTTATALSLTGFDGLKDLPQQKTGLVDLGT